MTRVGGRLGLLVALTLLTVSVAALPMPCADDLLVELGAADQCLTQPEDGDGGPAASGLCPCACHVPMTSGPTPATLPVLRAERLRSPDVEGGREAVPPPITHPPLA